MTHNTEKERASTCYRVRLFGLAPGNEPCAPEHDGYTVTADNDTVETVLGIFALDRDKVTVLKNGRHADLRAAVEPGDTISIFLKVLGG